MTFTLFKQPAWSQAGNPAPGSIGDGTIPQQRLLPTSPGSGYPEPGSVVLGGQGGAPGPGPGDMVLGGPDAPRMPIPPEAIAGAANGIGEAGSLASGVAFVGQAGQLAQQLQQLSHDIPNTARAWQDAIASGFNEDQYEQNRIQRLQQHPDQAIEPDELQRQRERQSRAHPNQLPSWTQPVDPNQTPYLQATQYVVTFQSQGRTDGPYYVRGLKTASWSSSVQPGQSGDVFLHIVSDTTGDYTQRIYSSPPVTVSVVPAPGQQGKQTVPQSIPTNYQPQGLDQPLNTGSPLILPQPQQQTTPQQQQQQPQQLQHVPQTTPQPQQTTPQATPKQLQPQNTNQPVQSIPNANNLLPQLLGPLILSPMVLGNTPLQLTPQGNVNPLQFQQPNEFVPTETEPCQNAGSCSASLNNKLNNTNNKLDKLMAGLQAADLAALLQGLAELKALIGKVQSTLDATIEWLQLDRLLNILTWLQTLHNAYMLSNALEQTLFSTIDGLLGLFGVHLKDANGHDISVSKLFGDTINNIGKQIFGVDTWTGIKAEWKTFNRIYQAATNLLYAMQALFYSVLAALEVTASYVASIGNALKKWRVIGHSAFGWMNIQPNFHNSLFTNLNKGLLIVSQINFVVQTIEGVKSIVEQMGTQEKELQKDLGEVVPSQHFTENTPTATAEATAQKSAPTPTVTLDDLNKAQ